jgi:phosphoglucosamine mutase
LVRPSGTEPVIRVMTEGEDEAEITTIARELCEVIRKSDRG